MASIENIVRQMVKCLGIKEGEKITVIADYNSMSFMNPVRNIINPDHFFNLDDYKRPLADVPNEISEAIKESDLTFYAIDKVADEKINELDMRRKLCQLAEQKGRVGNLLSITPEVLESAFSYDTGKIRDFTLKLQDYMRSLKAVKVTTPYDTNLVLEFNPESWQASTGFIERKKTRNVMPAEVYAKPASVEGDICIDGVYSHLLTLPKFKKDIKSTLQRLKENPMFWKIRGRKIYDIICNDIEISSAALNYVFSAIDQESEVIDEFGMGTNLGIKKLLGVVMHDEKYPGVHVANGNSYNEFTLHSNKYSTAIHSDGIILGATVRNLDNGKLILDKGRYVVDFKTVHC